MAVGPGLREAYEGGAGHVVLRAKVEVEGDGARRKRGSGRGGATQLVISEVPYQTSKVRAAGGRLCVRGFVVEVAMHMWVVAFYAPMHGYDLLVAHLFVHWSPVTVHTAVDSSTQHRALQYMRRSGYAVPYPAQNNVHMRYGRPAQIVSAQLRIELRAAGNDTPQQHIRLVPSCPLLPSCPQAELVEKIAELVEGKEVEGVADVRDESDRNGVRVVVEVRTDLLHCFLVAALVPLFLLCL